VQRQIVLPLSKAIEIAYKSIRLRLSRRPGWSTSGIVLALAFLMSILTDRRDDRGDAAVGGGRFRLLNRSSNCRRDVRNWKRPRPREPSMPPQSSELDRVRTQLIAPAAAEGDDEKRRRAVHAQPRDRSEPDPKRAG